MSQKNTVCKILNSFRTIQWVHLDYANQYFSTTIHVCTNDRTNECENHICVVKEIIDRAMNILSLK